MSKDNSPTDTAQLGNPNILPYIQKVKDYRITYSESEYKTLNVKIERVESYNGEDELIITGGIRFDGCSNWQWHALGIHLCGWQDMRRLSNAIKQAYHYASAFYAASWAGDLHD